MEEEISIRDLIFFAKKYAWLIMLTGFISASGYIIIALSTPAIYTASVSFLVNQATLVTQGGDIKKVGLSTDFYITLLRDDVFFRGLPFNAKGLPNISPRRIKVESENNIINLVFKNPDPVVAKSVLEVIADGLSTQIKKIRNSQRGLLEVMHESRKILEKKMTTLARKIEEYKKEKNVDGLHRKLSMYNNLIDDYESRLLKYSDDIKILEANRAETEAYLKKEEERLKLTKFVGKDIMLYEAAKTVSDKKASELLQLKTEEEVINPTYQSLKSQLISLNIKLSDLKNQKEILLPKLEEVRKEANKIRIDLISIERKLGNMQLEYDSLRSRYLELIKNETNIQAFGPYSIGDITFLGPVHVSDKPESKIKVKWLGVSGLCGLFVGIIFGFLKESYYKSEKVV